MPKAERPTLKQEVAAINDKIRRGESLLPPPAKTLGERLAEAIRERAVQTESGLVAVSNRHETSTVFLRQTDSGLAAKFSLSAQNVNFTGEIELSETGEITKADAHAVRSAITRLVAFGEHANQIFGVEGERIDPALPYRLSEGRYSWHQPNYEVPLNTLVQIAENGHVNKTLTTTARLRNELS